MHDSRNFSFVLLKAYFRCSQRVMDININTLPQVFYPHLALNNYCQLQEKKNSEQSLALALRFEKRVYPAEAASKGVL